MNHISDPDNHPSIIEGKGTTAIRIYFESEDTRQIWLELCGETNQKISKESLKKSIKESIKDL